MHKYSSRFIKKNDKRDLAIFNKLLKQTNKSHRVNQYHSYLYTFDILHYSFYANSFTLSHSSTRESLHLEMKANE